MIKCVDFLVTWCFKINIMQHHVLVEASALSLDLLL